MGVTPDPYLEEKIAKGLKSPQWDWISESEANAVINGRYRGDGRRIDQWTVPEGPMEIDIRATIVKNVVTGETFPGPPAADLEVGDTFEHWQVLDIDRSGPNDLVTIGLRR